MTARIGLFIEQFEEFDSAVVAEASRLICNTCKFWPSVAELREVLIKVQHEFLEPQRIEHRHDYADQTPAPYRCSEKGAVRIACDVTEFERNPSAHPLSGILAKLGRNMLERHGFTHLLEPAE